MRCALLILLACLCCGCGHTAVVNSWEPADIDVSGMNRVAVMDFSGEQGKSVAGALASRIWENRFYTVVDRTELQGPIQPAGFEENRPPVLKDLLGPAKAAGVNGVILGEVVEYRCDDRHLESTRFRLRGDGSRSRGLRGLAGGAGFEIDETLIREGTVTVAFRLFDVKTAEVRAFKQVSHHYEGKRVNGEGELPPRGEVLERLTQLCLDDIVSMLAPHEIESQIQLAICDVWTRGRRDVKKGVALAGEGDWAAARQRWEQALESNPANHAALFNLAVAAAHEQNYALAEDLAMRALRIEHEDCYARGVESIRRHRAAFEKSAEQRDSKLVTAAETTPF